MSTQKKSKKTRLPRPKKNSRTEKVFHNLCQVVPQFMAGRGYEPLNAEELMQRLSLPETHTTLFIKVLEELIRRGEIYCKQGRYARSGATQTVVKGTLRVHQRGFGFLQPDGPTEWDEEVFIPKHLTRNAVDGDTVEVLVDTASISPKGPEGRVISILKRGRTHLAGTVCEILHDDTAYAHVPLIGTTRRILIKREQTDELREGDRVILKVLDWGGSAENPIICEKSHYIGHISDPSCDIPAAIEEFDLRGDFPSACLKEAAAYGTKVSQAEIKRREDFRSFECFTIDPDTAKDFDDALSLHIDKSGYYHLGVHIADVSHYVKSDTALDLEAQKRCNSTYFPGFCLPMLPYELSNELCSLKPGVNRLAVSVLMTFDPQGTLCEHRIVRSVIKSKKRFTYKEAKAVLDGRKNSPHAKTLKNMVELCRLLKVKRYERGGIEFVLPEMAIYCDDKGFPIKTERIEYDITHQLVEEFMLKANEMVATHLSQQDQHLAFRVHEEPSEDNMKEFALLARSLGFKLPDKPKHRDLQLLFDEAMATPFGPQLAVSYIRSMRLAYYSPFNLGHYGLSLQYYCHFTSPIRRYIDLVIHRIICGDIHDMPKLESISLQCSDQERVSAKAEQNVLLLKKLRLVDANRRKGEMEYRAFITRIKNAGIVFDIPDIMLDGFIHISQLGDDFYLFDEKLQLLKGRYSGETFKMGQSISVALLDVNLITLDSSFKLVKTNHKQKPKRNIKRKTKNKKRKR